MNNKLSRVLPLALAALLSQSAIAESLDDLLESALSDGLVSFLKREVKGELTGLCRLVWNWPLATAASEVLCDPEQRCCWR